MTESELIGKPPHKDSNERIYEILLDKDEVTWQSLLNELVKTEEMDPWDINITKLTQKYIETIKELKELDFRLSGKVLLAAAFLLKIKSHKLLNDDLSEFDALLIEPQDEDLDNLDLTEEQPIMDRYEEKPSLIPRTPQPRKRKVSIFDLMNALEKALEVKQRRVLNSVPPTHVAAPKKVVDISQIIKSVYGKIASFFKQHTSEKLTFKQLASSDTKEDKVYTFIPLLHLSNQHKINLAQDKPFDEIKIMMYSDAAAKAEEDQYEQEQESIKLRAKRGKKATQQEEHVDTPSGKQQMATESEEHDASEEALSVENQERKE